MTSYAGRPGLNDVTGSGSYLRSHKQRSSRRRDGDDAPAECRMARRRYLTTREAAARLGLSQVTIRRQYARGRLVGFHRQVGPWWRLYLDPVSVEAYRRLHLISTRRPPRGDDSGERATNQSSEKGERGEQAETPLVLDQGGLA